MSFSIGAWQHCTSRPVHIRLVLSYLGLYAIVGYANSPVVFIVWLNTWSLRSRIGTFIYMLTSNVDIHRGLSHQIWHATIMAINNFKNSVCNRMPISGDEQKLFLAIDRRVYVWEDWTISYLYIMEFVH